MTDPAPQHYRDNVLGQRTAIPGIYGNVDFSILPERYRTDIDPDEMPSSRYRAYAQRVKDNPALIETIRN